MKSKAKNGRCEAYFTVEAALMMPIVLGCYYLIIVLLCFSYERCTWEQNAYRLPVWMEYVEGFGGLSAEKSEELSKENVCRYVLARLDNAEEEKYIFARNTTAQIQTRGEVVTIKRKMQYTLFADETYEMKVAGVCLEPVEYIRMTNMLKDKINQEERNDNDQN